MENEVLYDPLSFDNHIISEKLGMYDYIPANSSRDINVNLKMAMLQQELEKSRAIAEKNKAIAAHLHAKNKQQSKQQAQHSRQSETQTDHPQLTNTQFVLLVVFIAVAVCVIQYISYRSSMSEMMQIINNFVRSVPIAFNGKLDRTEQTSSPTEQANVIIEQAP